MIHHSQVNCPLLNHAFYSETSLGISMLNQCLDSIPFFKDFLLPYVCVSYCNSKQIFNSYLIQTMNMQMDENVLSPIKGAMKR